LLSAQISFAEKVELGTASTLLEAIDLPARPDIFLRNTFSAIVVVRPFAANWPDVPNVC